MSTLTSQYVSLNHATIEWTSLQDICDSLQNAQLTVHEGQRFVVIKDQEIPINKVINEIYNRRPSLPDSNDDVLITYFDATKTFTNIVLPQNEEKSIFRKIADCFWECYGPLQFCWCTSGCRENIIIADSKLGLEGIEAWRDHLELSGM